MVLYYAHLKKITKIIVLNLDILHVKCKLFLALALQPLHALWPGCRKSRG